jgi:hypothetical protein
MNNFKKFLFYCRHRFIDFSEIFTPLIFSQFVQHCANGRERQKNEKDKKRKE